MGVLLPGAAWRPVAYRADAGPFTTAPLGWILHVVVGNGSPWGGFSAAQGSGRRFSTGWVAKDGHGEQYVELTGKSWAQVAGNGTYWSFETEGYPGEALTDAQITTLATWHNYLGTPDLIADLPGQRGIGTHVMGGAAWGGHTCPGPGPRATQRAAIITRARELRDPAHITPEDDMYTDNDRTATNECRRMLGVLLGYNVPAPGTPEKDSLDLLRGGDENGTEDRRMLGVLLGWRDPATPAEADALAKLRA